MRHSIEAPIAAFGAVNGFATVGSVLDSLAAGIAGPSCPPARQEARDLIAAVLDVPRFWPSGHRERALTSEELGAIDDAAARLTRGMPFAYAVRRAAFRSLSLYVDERVLIPRPETEVIVDVILDATNRGAGTVIDVGTGSGCIALALATEGKFSRVIATDVSEEALAVARRNIAAHSGPGKPAVEVLCGSFLAPCVGIEADVVVSNPPYISWSEAADLPALVRDWEPAVALFADDDGMSAIERIASQAARVLRTGGMLALEVDSRRAGRAAQLVSACAGYRDVIVRPDLTGRERFVLARRGED
jgi:release factor glutamine methyltransferase